nr:MAG TPA: hypothetical protein [Caudoviricetes sp.]
MGFSAQDNNKVDDRPAQQARRWPAFGMPQVHRLKVLTHSAQGEQGKNAAI